MSDLIDRQEVIDELEGRIKVNGYSNVALVSELNKCIGYIMRLPSAEPNLITKIQDGIKATDVGDVYSCGMRNGMRWCVSLIDGKEPLYENCPSAQPETQWIPCSEETGDGYPEEDGLYYVTEQNYGFYLDAECKQRVTHTSHFKNGDFTDRFYTENSSNITAWMPLPKSYKEE